MKFYVCESIFPNLWKAKIRTWEINIAQVNVLRIIIKIVHEIELHINDACIIGRVSNV